MALALALDQRLVELSKPTPTAARDFKVTVNLEKVTLKAIRQRLYASLDADRRSEMAAEEREKLARVVRLRDAVARLAHLCREEIIGGIRGLQYSGTLGRQVQRLYDALDDEI
jgi:hypothetical protein